jgi:hypothetical protein
VTTKKRTPPRRKRSPAKPKPRSSTRSKTAEPEPPSTIGSPRGRPASREPYTINRARVAKCDLDELAKLNADLLVAARDQALGLSSMTREELAGARELRQQLKMQIRIDDARRDRLEIDELRDLVAELREVKEYIQKHGASDGSVGASTATH